MGITSLAVTAATNMYRVLSLFYKEEETALLGGAVSFLVYQKL